MTFAYRELEDGDIPDVLEVMRQSLGEPPGLGRTEELFRWKHTENPFGRSIMLVATEADRIIGFRAFMRWELTTPAGGTVRCVRPVDTATHPDFQRRGIFRGLTESAVELAGSEGVDLVFNTPNPQSGAGYQRMGWEIAGGFGVMIRPGLRFLGHDSHLAGRQPQSTPSGCDRAPIGFRTLRSAAYRRWRFQAHPTADYVTLGDSDDQVICRQSHRRGRRELVISEIVGNPAAQVSQATRHLTAHYSVAWFNKGAPERSMLTRRGFITVPYVTSLTLATRPLADLPMDPTRMENWDFGFGDLELL